MNQGVRGQRPSCRAQIALTGDEAHRDPLEEGRRELVRHTADSVHEASEHNKVGFVILACVL